MNLVKRERNKAAVSGVGMVMIAIILQGCQGCSRGFGTTAAHTTNIVRPRSTMNAFTLANPGIVTTFAPNDNETFTIDLIGPQRILHTNEFDQDGIELEKLTSEKPVSWGVPVPEDALVFGGTSAVPTGFSHQFWVGWLVGRRLHMQALMQVKPIDTELAVGEISIFPAVTDFSGIANLYTWRAVSGGTALWRHSFTGQIKTAGTVTEEALSEIPGHPVVSVAGTIPGERSQHAVIGWLEATPGGAVMGMAIVKPDRLRVVRSKPIPGMAPFMRQRLAVWAEVSPDPNGKFQLSAALQSQAEPPMYNVAVLNVSPDSDEGAVDLSDSGISAGALHSAAFDYQKQSDEPFYRRTFLTEEGTVMTGDPQSGFFVARFHGVDLDSPLPVVTSLYTYWGTRKADGTMTFEWF